MAYAEKKEEKVPRRGLDYTASELHQASREILNDKSRDKEYSPLSPERDKDYVRRIAREVHELGEKLRDPGMIKLADELYKKIGESPPLIPVKKTLEKTLFTISMTFFLAAVLFLSGNLTGNFIGNIPQNNSNLIGGVLFIAGLASCYIYFKKFRKSKK